MCAVFLDTSLETGRAIWNAGSGAWAVLSVANNRFLCRFLSLSATRDVDVVQWFRGLTQLVKPLFVGFWRCWSWAVKALGHQVHPLNCLAALAVFGQAGSFLFPVVRPGLRLAYCANG